MSSSIISRTCRTCHKQFTENHEKACRFHPESFSGETAQRWMPPGETKVRNPTNLFDITFWDQGAAEIHYFYTCCGLGLESSGCCARPHLTFDDPEDFSLRLPGPRLSTYV